MDPPPSNGKWSRWAALIEQKNDKPREHTLLRRIAGPIICAVIAAMVLVVLNPPFVCSGKKSALSPLRLMVWATIAGCVCALMTAQGVFARFAKC